MSDRIITLDAEIVERLEALAQGRNLNDVLGDLIAQADQPQEKNWALSLAEDMAAADIEWIDDPDASTRSREHFAQHVREKWERTQKMDSNNG